jgi:hypothetical protein
VTINLTTITIISITLTQWNPYLMFLQGPVDLNTQLRKILNGGNLTVSLLTWDHWNWMLKEGKP